jgi:hypothetical protein
MDKREDTGNYYPGGTVVSGVPVPAPGVGSSVEVVAPSPDGGGKAADAKAVYEGLERKAGKTDIPYSLVEATIDEGSVTLQDRVITKVIADDSVSSIAFIFPKKVDGKLRDFFIRLVITGETVPTLSFIEPNGDAVSFDMDDDSWAEIEQGVNILMFTDTEE